MARKGNRKVRTGCITCKVRKVKCDEAKPSCSRCTSTGRKCDGYAPQQKQIQQQRSHTLCLTNINRPFQYVENQNIGRALQYFCNTVGPALSGDQDRYFWTHLVLQFTNTQPAVRYSIATISMLYEQLPDDSNGRHTDQDQYTALAHYNAAIGELRAMSASEKQPLVLLVCILFICIEMLQRNREVAVQHCKHGINMLENCPPADYYWAQQYLGPVFRRLIVFPFFFGSGDADYPSLNLLASLGRRSFESFADARYMADELFSRSLRLYCLGAEYRYGPLKGQPAPSNLLVDQRLNNNLLDNWRCLFSTFLQSGVTSSVPIQDRSLLMSQEFLSARINVCRVATNMAFEKNEKGYDQYIPHFQRVLKSLESIAARLPMNGLTRPKVHNRPSRFTFEMGFMPNLCFCILKCRHLETRIRLWRLLPILSNPQESLWQLDSMISLDRRLIEMEHGIKLGDVQNDSSLYTSELPPETARIRTMWVDSKTTRRVIDGRDTIGRIGKFYMLGKDGETHIRTEFLC